MSTFSPLYILQIGTRWDGSQNLIWAQFTEPASEYSNLHIPKPRRYRNSISRFMEEQPGKGVAHQFISDLMKPSLPDAQGNQQVLLGLTSLMQPTRYFCPAGDWFDGLGSRISILRELLDPCIMVVMLNPRNPAKFLSNAWASGAYPGFEDVPPDPFTLSWSGVVEDVQRHNPETQILVCPVEVGPVVWPLALQVLSGISDTATKTLQRAVALYDMVDEGKARLIQYLEDQGDIPLNLSSRIITGFLKAYRRDKVHLSDCAIPGWTEAKSDMIEAQYEKDLNDLQKMEGIHFWGGSE